MNQSFSQRLIACLTAIVIVLTTLTSASAPAFADSSSNTSPECVNNGLGKVECTIIKDDKVIIVVPPNPPPQRSDAGKVEAFFGGVITGAVGGSASTVAMISAAGSVSGLSAAGVTSGLAAIGSVVGGGMVAGVAVTTAAPVVAAAGVGYAAYKAWDFIHRDPAK